MQAVFYCFESGVVVVPVTGWPARAGPGCVSAVGCKAGLAVGSLPGNSLNCRRSDVCGHGAFLMPWPGGRWRA